MRPAHVLACLLAVGCCGAGHEPTGPSHQRPHHGDPAAIDTAPGALATPDFARDVDADDDGVWDRDDTCPGADDTRDDDGDGVPDGCDRCVGYDDLTYSGESCPPVPEDCADRQAEGATLDGDYALYWTQDAALPWTAHCVDMAGEAKTYLALVYTGGDYNFGQYTAGAGVPGTNVRTSYTEVRIDTASGTIDTGDQVFTTSVGALVHGSVDVTTMPLGVGMDCLANASMQGPTNVNLRDTPFMLAEPWIVGGNLAGGQATVSPDYREVNAAGGGLCGWIAPGVIAEPYNDAHIPLTIAYAR